LVYKPGDRPVLIETIVSGVVVGIFTGYRADILDDRVNALFQSLNSWDSTLRKVGFSGLGAVLDDFPEPYNATSVISFYNYYSKGRKAASI
jgi:hypothetical protein